MSLRSPSARTASSSHRAASTGRSDCGIWRRGKTVQTFVGHFSLISSVAFAPDGKTIASGGYDNAIKLWDTATGKEIRTIAGHTSEVTGVAFSPDGTTLASCSRDKFIKLWNPTTGQLIRTLEGHAFDVFAIAFSPDGKLLASGSYDKTIRLWDVSTWEACSYSGRPLGSDRGAWI